MACDLTILNKRKSYISLVRKHTNRTDSYFGDMNLGDLSTYGSEWKVPMLENSIVENR